MNYTKSLTKVALFILLMLLIASCDAVKRVPAGQRLLVEQTIIVDSVATSDIQLQGLLSQQPNSRFLNVPLGLHLYNLARPNRDSIYIAWAQNNPEKLKRREQILSKKQTAKLATELIKFNAWLKRTGDAPVIVNDDATKKSEERLQAWHWNNGWFNNTVRAETVDVNKPKRARTNFYVSKGNAYVVDSLHVAIKSPDIDSLYTVLKKSSLINLGEQYRTTNFNSERERLYTAFRNRGIYYMQKEYITFEGDTVGTDYKANMTLKISDRKIQLADTVLTEPLKVYKISKINIVPDYQDAKSNTAADSSLYKGYNIVAYGKSKYRKQSLTDAISFKPGDIYRAVDESSTYRNISQLNSFQYPNIRFKEDPADSTKTSLIANVLLTSKEKYKFVFGFEGTHSNVQTFGLGLNTSLLVRNLFRGSELLNISFRGNIGASSNTSSLNSVSSEFFDLREFGADATLNFPRLFLPFRLDNTIPKSMSPSSSVSLGFFSQTNIGLDKQSFNSALQYRWQQTPIKNTQLDLIKVQYVRNLDPGNFFNVYGSSYESLNNIANDINLTNPIYVNAANDLSIPAGTNFFITDAASGILSLSDNQRETVRNIGERRDRLVQDNLIISTSYKWTRNTQQGIYDDDFSRVTLSIEGAGNLLSGIASLTGVIKESDGSRRIFGVQYTQYIKPEIDYVRRWQFANKNVMAMRMYGGIAIPYGNSNNVPFIRSFFAGGPNDNRAWQAYELGPGGTGGLNDFNDANMKLAFNAEYRFPIINSFKGALFTDIGNIWNVLDSEDDPKAQFNNLRDLEYLAVGIGFGIRYDFGFFVLRLDAGFKAYNPALDAGNRWLNDVNLSKSVLNVGINYPF